MTAMTATSVCTEFLSGLDSDVLEYIVGILEDADSNLDREDGIEMIAGLLVSAEFCDSEDLAAMKAAAIFEKLKPLALGVIGGGTGTSTSIDTSTDKVSKIGPTSSGTRSHRKKNAGKSKKKGKNKPININTCSAVDDNDNDNDNDNDTAENNGTANGTSKLTKPMTGLSLDPPIDIDIDAPTPTPTIVPVEVTQETEPEHEHEPEPEPETETPEAKTKAEKQASKAAAKAARLAKKASRTGQKGNPKMTLAQKALAQAMEIDQELTDARIAAVKARRKMGSFRGALDAKEFTLPNPGGGQPLLEDAACTLTWGRRYGLIGRNGIGKSTMLRAFAARRVGDVPANVTVHYVSQEVNLTPSQALKTPVECVVDADVERTLLLAELKELEAKIETESLDAKGLKQHEQVLQILDEIDADTASRRAVTLLENLGFSRELQARPLSQLSGGWRVRTMLAAAIFSKPDLLLLDEPTNHLSILAVMWLARELATSETWKERMVVVVSHDRSFMDEVCTDCLHISGAAKRLTQCRGNVSDISSDGVKRVSD